MLLGDGSLQDGGTAMLSAPTAMALMPPRRMPSPACAQVAVSYCVRVFGFEALARRSARVSRHSGGNGADARREGHPGDGDPIPPCTSLARWEIGQSACERGERSQRPVPDAGRLSKRETGPQGRVVTVALFYNARKTTIPGLLCIYSMKGVSTTLRLRCKEDALR